MDPQDKKEFWMRIKSFQSDKACSILSKYQKGAHITEQALDGQLKPHLDWLKLEAKQKIFQSFIKYKKFMEDTQQFRSCRVKFYIFQTWKNRFVKKTEQKNILQHHFNVKYNNVLEKVLQAWRDIAAKKSLLKQRYRYLKIQSKYNLLEKYFYRWYDKYDYYIQNKEEIIKGYQINSDLTKKRIFQALVNYSQISKEKKEQYQYAFTHYYIALSKKVFRGYEIYRERRDNYFKKIEDVDEYSNLKDLKRFFKSWKKHIIQEKMVNNMISQRLYKKVISALFIYSERMKTLNEQVENFIQKKESTYQAKGFKGFINYYILQQQAMQKGFSYYYMRKLSTAFNELFKYKDRKQRKCINVVEYLKEKKRMLITNSFMAWKIRSQMKQRKRHCNKIAVNNFIHNLFKKFIFVLRNNVKRKQLQEYVIQQIDHSSMKKFFNEWRSVVVDSKCEKHRQTKTLKLIVTSWKEYIEEKRQKLLKRREAALLYQAKLMKLVRLFIESLQMNKQRKNLKKSEMLKHTKMYEKTTKRTYFNHLKKQVKINKQNNLKAQQIQKQHTKFIFSDVFKYWLSLLQKSNSKNLAIVKMIEINQANKIKESFQTWMHFVKLMQYEDALDQKSQNLRDYLLVKKFYKAVKQRSLDKVNEQQMTKAADYYYKRSTFFKFVNAFYNSIQEKKQKQISLKHYAIKIFSSSFYSWKKFTQERYERQFYKIMSSSKRDNMLDNSISNYVSEEVEQQQQQHQQGIQGNLLGTNSLSMNSTQNNNNNNFNLTQMSNFNSALSNNNSTLSVNKDNFNFSNNPSNVFKNSANKKFVTFSKTQQDDLLTNNLNYTGLQEDLSKYQLDGSIEYQSN